MKQEKLLKAVRSLYLEARIPKFSKNTQSNNINRCTSHSISSEFEDLLAQYCFDLINDPSIQIYIDPQLSFPDLKLKNNSGKKSFLYRPDIIIVKNNKVEILIDAKTDLGFKRSSYLNMIETMENIIDQLSGQVAVFSPKTGQHKIKYRFSENIKLTYFVASNKYFSKSNYIDDEAINLRKRINIFFLSEGHHLNNYNNIEIGENGIKLNTNSISKFDEYILNTLSNK